MFTFAKEFGWTPEQSLSLNVLEEWLYIEQLNAHYKREAEAYGGGESSDNYASPDDPASINDFGSDSEFGEGVAVRNFKGNYSDGTWKPYYPSASKGDRMATGEELQQLFGITYVDERN